MSQVSSENNGRMRKLRSLYTPWMLLATFISFGYTNVIRSISVVPEMRYEDVSFDQMVQQDFSFFSAQFSFIRSSTSMEYEERSVDKATTAAFILREKAIVERVRSITEFNISTLVGISQKAKRVIVDSSFNLQSISDMLQVRGRNVVWSMERFFEMPQFWWFLTQKSFILVHSLEWMKAAGLVEYLLEQIDMDKRKGLMNYAKNLEEQDREKSEAREDQSDGTATGLSDSVVFEAFVILLYGTITSLIAVTLELVARHVVV